MPKTNRYPKHGLVIATGEIFDDVVRSATTTSTGTPLGKPTSPTVKSKHLGNALNATRPADTRVAGYAVYRATRSDDAVAKTFADAAFVENIGASLPWTDHHSSTNDLLTHVHDYWLVSLDRAYVHYQTAALDALYMGHA